MVSDVRMPATVIIPAHNESASIRRLLDALAPGQSAESPRDSPALEVLVVCNGCTDDTAAIARQYEPGVRVMEIPEASKRHALDAGDAAAHGARRAYVDADVVISRTDILRLFDALSDTHMVTAPARHLDLTGSSWLVRSYYEVWRRLPQVESGVFGRGVVVMSPAAHARVRRLPPVMSDDLAASEAFGPGERVVVTDATVSIQCPRTFPDLLRRRIRVATGNRQLDDLALRTNEARTSGRTLVAIAVARPGIVPAVGVFAMVSFLARLGAARRVRRGDYTTWLRDESSRRPGGGPRVPA